MIIKERLNEILDKELIQGSGKDIDHGCVMQMVSYIAGEEWTDHPKCACPVLTSVAIKMNDRFPSVDRQKMKSLIPLLVGTRSTPAVEKERANFLVHRMITVSFPILTDLIKMPELSAQLRAIENNKEGFKKAETLFKGNRAAIKKNAASAAAYAYASAYASAAASAAAYAYASAYASAAASSAAAAAYASAAAAYASAYASAAASAAAYAYASAYASSAAAAAAYAYASAYASAAAAYASATKIRESQIESLQLACLIGVAGGAGDVK